MNKGKGSAVWNTVALPKAIKNIVVTYNTKTFSDKYPSNSNLVITTGAAMVTAAGSTTVTGSKSEPTVTYTPTAKSDTFVHFSHSGDAGAFYLDSIVINFVD